MSAIILFYGVNLMGLKMSSRTQNVLMIIKIEVGRSSYQFTFFPSNYASQTIKAIVPDPSWNDYIKSFGIALIAVSFTYGGYQQTINFGEEVENPRKTIPRGIFIGILNHYCALSY